MVSLLPDRFRSLREVYASNLAFWVGLGFFALYVTAALLGQQQLIVVMALGMLACVGVICVRLPMLCCALWLLVVGTTPEMWVPSIAAGTANLATALVKVSGFGLVAICLLRYGAVLDLFNPGFAFVLMFFTGLGHGLYPTLTITDSLRTVIGSAAPYAFSFCRLSRRWCAALIETTIWVPLICLLFGLLLTALGIRSFLSPDEGGSVRVGGSSHPAFLATMAMTSVYACLIELYRNGRTRYLLWLAFNFAILVSTGSRSPLFCAVLVLGIAFFAIRSNSFTLRKRILPMLLGLLMLPVLLAVSATSNSLRLLALLSGGQARGLSGRDLIWPYFEAAWSQSPLFGWGVGTGKILVDPDSALAKLLGTTAAHNEYLRIGVDGGYVGLGLVFLFMILWTWRWSRILGSSEKLIIRLVMVGFAIESITDNTLIAAPCSVLFLWVSAVFARGAIEQEQPQSASALQAAA